MHAKLSKSTVRPFRDGDAVSLAEHLNDPVVWNNLRDRVPHPYRVEDAKQFIAMVSTEDPVQKFAIDVNGAAVGSCGVQPKDDVYHRTVEIGFWLGRAYWGRGIVSEIVPALTSWAFEVFGPARIEAEVFAFNPASARVLEKAGFVREATLRDAVTKAGRQADLWVYAKFPD